MLAVPDRPKEGFGLLIIVAFEVTNSVAVKSSSSSWRAFFPISWCLRAISRSSIPIKKKNQSYHGLSFIFWLGVLRVFHFRCTFFKLSRRPSFHWPFINDTRLFDPSSPNSGSLLVVSPFFLVHLACDRPKKDSPFYHNHCLEMLGILRFFLLLYK